METEVAKRYYETFGPFSFGKQGLRHRESLDHFWNEREHDGSPIGLSEAVGVYVWNIQQEGKRVPWNVGRTDKQGFRKRFIQKEVTFRRFADDHPSAVIDVYLVALRSPSGRFRKATTHPTGLRDNDWLETLMIGTALEVNRNLANTSKTRNLRGIVVDGFLNDDKQARSPAALSFAEMLSVQR